MVAQHAMLRAAVGLCAGFAVLAAQAANISMRSLADGRYEFVLTNATPLIEDQARAEIMQAAGSSACQGAYPVAGRWRFESQEPTPGSPPVPAGKAAFRFVQEVSCEANAPVLMTAPRAPLLKDEAEAQQARETVKRKSEAFLQAIATSRVDDALKQVNMAQLGVDEARWRAGKLAFQALAGEPAQIRVVRLTVYDNPAQAPQPGVYVAADYSNTYRNVPIHCGYLMWVREADGDFRIMREETGHVTAEQLKTISVMRLPELKRQLRCREP